MTEPLSPAAEAVDETAHNVWVTKDAPRPIAAAVLRTAANFGEYLYDSQDGKIAVVRVADLEAWATELMPRQMHEDLAAAVRAMAEQEGIDSTRAKGVMRIMLNRHVVDLARAVLARWGRPAAAPVAIPGEKYHEDMGPVTWWRLPVDEPPWVGTPNDSDWPGYHTHFTPAPTNPLNAHALPLPTPDAL